MRHSIFILITLLIVALPISITCQFWRNPKPCSSPFDCGLDECCAIGFARFSGPFCRPLGGEGDWCYEDNEPENRTIYYPNGASEQFTDVHRHFCPCSSQYTCEHNRCTLWPFKAMNEVNDAYYIPEVF